MTDNTAADIANGKIVLVAGTTRLDVCLLGYLHYRTLGLPSRAFNHRYTTSGDSNRLIGQVAGAKFLRPIMFWQLKPS